MSSRIAAVEGYYSRARSLVEVIDYHQRLQEQHEAAAQAPAAPQAELNVRPPSQLLFNPRYRPARFMNRRPGVNRQRSLSLEHRLDHGDQADLPPWERMLHAEFPAIDPIPGNHPMERPMLAERAYVPQMGAAVLPDKLPEVQAQHGVPLALPVLQKYRTEAQRQRGQFFRLQSELTRAGEHLLGVLAPPLLQAA